MFDFIKKGIEFNKMAQAFNGMYPMLLDLMPRIENKDIPREEFTEEVLVLAYIAQKGVISRMTFYNWALESKILVPSISSARITVGYAISQTVTRILIIARILNIQDRVQEVLEEGPQYVWFETNLPQKFREL